MIESYSLTLKINIMSSILLIFDNFKTIFPFYFHSDIETTAKLYVENQHVRFVSMPVY